MKPTLLTPITTLAIFLLSISFYLPGKVIYDEIIYQGFDISQSNIVDSLFFTANTTFHRFLYFAIISLALHYTLSWLLPKEVTKEANDKISFLDFKNVQLCGLYYFSIQTFSTFFVINSMGIFGIIIVYILIGIAMLNGDTIFNKIALNKGHIAFFGILTLCGFFVSKNTLGIEQISTGMISALITSFALKQYIILSRTVLLSCSPTSGASNSMLVIQKIFNSNRLFLSSILPSIFAIFLVLLTIKPDSVVSVSVFFKFDNFNFWLWGLLFMTVVGTFLPLVAINYYSLSITKIKNYNKLNLLTLLAIPVSPVAIVIICLNSNIEINTYIFAIFSLLSLSYTAFLLKNASDEIKQQTSPNPQNKLIITRYDS